MCWFANEYGDSPVEFPQFGINVTVLSLARAASITPSRSGGVPRSRRQVQAARRGRGATPSSLGLLPLASLDGARVRGSWRQAVHANSSDATWPWWTHMGIGNLENVLRAYSGRTDSRSRPSWRTGTWALHVCTLTPRLRHRKAWELLASFGDDSRPTTGACSRRPRSCASCVRIQPSSTGSRSSTATARAPRRRCLIRPNSRSTSPSRVISSRRGPLARSCRSRTDQGFPTRSAPRSAAWRVRWAPIPPATACCAHRRAPSPSNTWPHECGS